MIKEDVVVLIRHKLFIEPKDATWLQYAMDLRVDGLERRGVDRGLDCLDGVNIFYPGCCQRSVRDIDGDGSWSPPSRQTHVCESSSLLV